MEEDPVDSIKISQLSLLNIRCYEEQRQTIKFDAPITFIHGSNGSGKTTIIECINLMLSGNMSLNSEGGKLFIREGPMRLWENTIHLNVGNKNIYAEKGILNESKNLKPHTIEYK